MRLNVQQEFTVHNIANGSFDLIYLNGTLILCMVTSAAFFCRKDRLFGFPLPSILLMLGFLVILSYETGVNFRGLIGENFREYVMDIRRSFGLIVIEEKVLLLLFLIFTLVSGQIKMFIASGATLALVLAFTYVNFHGDASKGSLYEVREYLFGICCLFYSVELLMTQRRLTAVSRKSGSSGTTGRTPLDPIAAPRRLRQRMGRQREGGRRLRTQPVSRRPVLPEPRHAPRAPADGLSPPPVTSPPVSIDSGRRPHRLSGGTV